MQENLAVPSVGRNSHVANERSVMARAKSVVSKCIRPIFVSGDKVVIRWVFHFDRYGGTGLSALGR
jgi:hypothetical protein